jgi:hypothetical protein
MDLAQTSGKPYRDVARDLGVSVDTLRAGGGSKKPSRIPGQWPPPVSPASWNTKTSACAANWLTPNGSVKS